MSKYIFTVSFLLAIVVILSLPVAEKKDNTDQLLREYLLSKGSPLAEHVDTLLKQKHWRLLVAISAIESQYCKRQLGFNCWGIGGNGDYRKYKGYDEAIIDANELIVWWQARGRWLTIEDMNCNYVVPCNPNWVNVVNKTLDDLEIKIPRKNK